MRGKKCILGLMACCSLSTIEVSAQSESESKLKANLSADLVSSYVWRGIKQAAGASAQPAVSASLSGFTLGVWGSVDVTSNNHKEVDFYAAYSSNNITITATDYWWDGEGAFHYFSAPTAGNVGHSFETAIAYTLPESFPLTLSWNTFILGQANKKVNGDNSFSTYVELAYPFSIKEVGFKISTGFTPWASTIYGTDKFSFTSVQLGTSKEIKITDSFSVPIFANVIVNPVHEDINFVFGITLR
nr:hypothetical protein [Dysgonomonas sp. GY617]